GDQGAEERPGGGPRDAVEAIAGSLQRGHRAGQRGPLDAAALEDEVSLQRPGIGHPGAAARCSRTRSSMSSQCSSGIQWLAPVSPSMLPGMAPPAASTNPSAALGSRITEM